MESIKKYVDKFFKNHEKNTRYGISIKEFMSAAHLARCGQAERVICDIFNFGYAKGYRAAMAEMKKGGAA